MELQMKGFAHLKGKSLKSLITYQKQFMTLKITFKFWN